MDPDAETRNGQVLETVLREYGRTVDRIYKDYEHSIDHSHRILILTAAMVGVVPALLSQSRLPVNLWFLRHGMRYLFLALTLGVLRLLTARVTLHPLLRSFGREIRGLADGVARAMLTPAGRTDAILGALTESLQSLQTRNPMATFLRYLNLVVFEAGFFVLFLLGLWNLFAAAYS